MARICSVCTHRDVKLIDEALRNGMSQRGAATRFGVTHDALRRHAVNGHIDDYDGPAPKVKANGTPREDLESVRKLLVAKLASGAIRTDEIRELRITLETLDKLSGGDKPEVTSVYDLDGYRELEAAMFDALEPYPDARKALAGVLRERMS